MNLYLVAFSPLNNLSIVLVTSKVHSSIVKFSRIVSWGKIHLKLGFRTTQREKIYLAGGQNDICSY